MPEHKHEFSVVVNHKVVKLPRAHISARDLLAEAGFEGKEWDLLWLDGKGDPSGGTLTDQNSVIELIKEEEHFRAIPGNRTFG